MYFERFRDSDFFLGMVFLECLILFLIHQMFKSRPCFDIFDIPYHLDINRFQLFHEIVVCFDAERTNLHSFISILWYFLFCSKCHF